MVKRFLLIFITLFFILFTDLLFDSYDIDILYYSDNTFTCKYQSFDNKDVKYIESSNDEISVNGSHNNVKRLNKTKFYVTEEFLDKVQEWEGFLGKSAFVDGDWDIGFGFHINYFDGYKYVKIKPGMTMTRQEARRYLRHEMEYLIQRTYDHIKKLNWNPEEFNNNQFLAITDYYYNRGYHSGADQIFKDGSNKTIEDVGNSLPKYWGSASYAYKGLINRRNYEKEFFFRKNAGTPVGPSDI